MKYRNNLINFSSSLLILIPFALLTGPFFPDLFLSIIGIIFLIISLYERQFSYFKNYFFYIFILFYIYLILSSILSEHPINSLKSVFFYFRFGIFSLALCFLLNNKKNIFNYLLISILASITFAIFDGIYQFYFDYNIFGYGTELARMTLPLGNNFTLGNYIARMLPLGLALYSIHLNFKSKDFFIICLVIIMSFIVIYLSGERTAIALSLLSIIYIFFMIPKLKIYKALITLVLLLSLFIMTSISSNIKERNITLTMDQFNILENIDNIRFFSFAHETLYSTAWGMFLDNKIFGIGPNNYRIQAINEDYYINDYSFSTHPHNTYLQLLAETGFIGFISIFFIFIFLITSSFRHLFSVAHKNKAIFSNYQICLIASFIISLWPIIPSLNFFNNWINIIYFLPVGFYLHTMEWNKTNIDNK